VHRNDNKNYHRKKNKKFYKRYNKFPQPQQQQRSNYDLRLIILRHGERIDLSLGANWYDQVFGGVPEAPPQSYQHPMLPHRLPHRKLTQLYVFDPPITRAGEQASVRRGQDLARLGLTADYCYSSPACRSILTANGILYGMNRRQTSIAIEPFLFEPLIWNRHLIGLPVKSAFMGVGDWINAGYNVDRQYSRLANFIDPFETEHGYYVRSQHVLLSIEEQYDKKLFSFGRPKRPTSILITGHAGTPIIFPTIALGEPFNAEEFGQKCGHIQFLQTVVLERDAKTRQWRNRPIPTFV
jgi:broad specificity phosphatase PhoE